MRPENQVRTGLPAGGSGFEPSVSLPRLSSIRAVRAAIIGRSTYVFRRDREFDVSALQGRLSTSSQSQCPTDPGLIAGTWHRPLFLTRDHGFESGSLQRRVHREPVRFDLSNTRMCGSIPRSWTMRAELKDEVRYLEPLLQ